MARTGWTWIVGATIAAAVVAAPAGGQPPGPGPGPERAAFAAFKRLDHSGSNSLGTADLASRDAGRSLLAILDGNGDGALTAADGGPARRLLHQFGRDRLTAAQFSLRTAARVVTALDADGDSRLALGELRPSLAGNAPLPEPAPPAPSPEVTAAARPQPCWLLTSQGTWITLPAWTPKCRLAP